MNGKPSKFSAADSLLGYTYQIRYALALMLTGRSIRSISIESLDDIEVEGTINSEIELHQTKHHITPGNVTDRSKDLWGTIRVWSDAIQSVDRDDQVRFFLVTTNQVTTDSIAGRLKPQSSGVRDAEAALQSLRDISKEVPGKENKSSYEAFRRLTPEDQHRLVHNIEVLDSSLNHEALSDELKEKLKLTVREAFIADFLERLEGWWLRKVLFSLVHKDHSKINYSEFLLKLHDLQEEYHVDNLPIHFRETPGPSEQELDVKERTFVEQLRIVMIQEPRIRKAITDYYRAYSQRSKWLRDGNLLISDLESYEKRLIDEWERLFLAAKEDLVGTEESHLQISGRKLFNAIEQRTDLRIRPRCDEPYVMRGTYHLLANDLRLGWHPEFLARLQHTIETAGANSE